MSARRRQSPHVVPPTARARLRERPGRKEADGHLFGILLSLVNAGWHANDAYYLLSDRDHVGAIALHRRQRKNEHTADRWFMRSWRNAEAKVARSPAVGDRHHVQFLLSQIVAAADARPELWSGRAGPRRRLVLDAAIYYARRANRLVIRLSERQVANFADIRPQTAGNHLHWHCELGEFLVKVSDAEGVNGTEYELRLPRAGTNRGSSAPPALAPGTATATQPVPDVFCGRGLGPSAGGIHRRLPTARVRGAESPLGDVPLVESPSGDGTTGRTLRERQSTHLTAEQQEGGGSAVGVAGEAQAIGNQHVPELCSGRGACRCGNVVRLPYIVEGPTVKELSFAQGIGIAAVQRNLANMAGFKMIGADSAGRLCAMPVDLNLIAEELGVLGRRQQARAIDDRQRLKLYQRLAARSPKKYALVEGDGRMLLVNPKTGEILREVGNAPVQGDALRRQQVREPGRSRR